MDAEISRAQNPPPIKLVTFKQKKKIIKRSVFGVHEYYGMFD
jgi:hypothetical protein